MDNNNDGNAVNDYDYLTDKTTSWGSFYGYLGSDADAVPNGFGQGDIQVLQNGPICIFAKEYDYQKFGYADEFEIPDNGESDVGSWSWFGGGVNPGYLAYRQSSTGRILGGIGVNIPYCEISAKESAAYDRIISFDDSSTSQNAKIYWYTDTSNDYQGIELLSEKVLNSVQIHVDYL